MSKKPVMLCIMDGFGWTPNETYGNAVAAANKPFIDSLMAKYPMTTIDASGMAVGLPDGQMGNSEVGHTNMGAGRIDGASEARTFISVVLPMVKPGIGALAIFTFINSWNDYFMQLIMLSSTSKLTISLGIAKLQAENSTDYGLIMAGAALAAVPIIIVFLAFQKYFTKGITMGAVKG